MNHARANGFQVRHLCKIRPVPTEPLMASSFPSRPWERLAMELFELHGKGYLIVIEYYSRWIESKRLDSLSSKSVVYARKEIFASHGIPDIIMSDNGPSHYSTSPDASVVSPFFPTESLCPVQVALGVEVSLL